jgi:hypothetical protein
LLSAPYWPDPIQLKQAGALLHSLWWWQDPSHEPIVFPVAERYVV